MHNCSKTMNRIISKKLLLVLIFSNAFITNYCSDHNREIKIYLNNQELKENFLENYYSKTKTSGETLSLETIRNELVNKFYKNKKKSISENGLTNNDIEFARAEGMNNEIIKIKNDIVPTNVKELYFLTKSLIEAIKKLKIDEVYINTSKSDWIDAKNITEEFQKRVSNNNNEIIKQGHKAIKNLIRQLIKNSENFKKLYNENSKDSMYNYTNNEIFILLQNKEFKNKVSLAIIDIEDYNNSNDPEKKCSVLLPCRYEISYNIAYTTPNNTELRKHYKDGDKYKVDNDGFGSTDSKFFPAIIEVSYDDKDKYDNRTTDEEKDKIFESLKCIYNEYENNTDNFNNLDKKIYKKEEEYKRKINNGSNIIIPEGKDWNTLKPGDTIKVELSEKSELVKSKIAKIKFNPPAGHQLKNELHNKEIPVVLTKGDFGKECLKEELSKMELDIDGKKIKLTADIINSITGNFDNTDEGVINGCNVQIPIGASDFIATEQEIKQREQTEKEGQRKPNGQDKKHQQIGTPEVAAKCCTCCGGCCKCNGGCCKENNNDG